MGLVEWVVDREVPGGRLRAGFTARAGGVSTGSYAGLNLGFHVGDDPEAVAENRRLLELEAPGLAWMDQVHGANVEAVDSQVLTSGAPGRTFADTDGLVIDAALHPCSAAVMVADCVPLLLLTGNRPLAAAVHVGRGGLLAGIAVKAVDELRRRGGEDVSAVLGPSICGRCYEVPPSMRDEADALAPGAAATTSWGTPSVDIPRALVRQLASRGVEEVRLLGVCTFEDPAYFSHRRACAAGGKAGRFAGIAEATRDTPA